jgi:AcrR family transcriptional regulator
VVRDSSAADGDLAGGRQANTSHGALVWTRPQRGSRGPAPERSREQITAAAVALADEGGLEAVSMRQVARALGTGPASLYRYIDSRDDLIDLMADQVTAELDLSSPPDPHWPAALVALAVQSKAVYLRHPWLLDVMAQRTPLGPRAVDYTEYVLRILDPVPASARTKLEIVGILSGLVTLFARTEVNLRRDGATLDQRQAAQAAYLARIAADGAHPHLLAALTATAASAAPEPDDAVFERVMHKILGALVR